MKTLRTRDDLDTLRSDLRTLRNDLREVARDIGVLTGETSRNLRQISARDWMDWARSRIGSREDLDEAWSGLRERGEKSATAVRSTVQEHPAAALAASLALGLALAWLVTRSARR